MQRAEDFFCLKRINKGLEKRRSAKQDASFVHDGNEKCIIKNIGWKALKKGPLRRDRHSWIKTQPTYGLD
jgi:hypothetical protein